MSVKALLATYKAEGPLEERRLPSPLDDLDRNELAVARWLLWRYNDKTSECTPSDRDLAVGTGLSARSVERARKSLRARGLIGWRERRAAGKRGSNEYDLTAILTVCDSSEQTANLTGSTPELTDNLTDLTAKSVGPNRQNGASQPDRLAEEQQHVELNEEPKNETAAAAAAAVPSDDDFEGEVHAVFEAWKKLTDSPDAKLTTKRREAVERGFEQYSAEELIKAVSKWKESPFHSGDNQTGKTFNDLTWLLKDDDVIEELLAIRSWGASWGSRGRGGGRLTDPALAKICGRPVDGYEKYDTTTETVEVSADPPEDSGAGAESSAATEVKPVHDHYAEEVEARAVFPRLAPAQIVAEHAEAVECLRHAEDSLESKSSPFRESAVESAKTEVARLERDYPDVLGTGEVAA